jgi:hypothetical protein
VAQVGIGYVINVGAQHIIFPLFGLTVPFHHHLGIGLCFMAISLARMYVISRAFAGRQT